MGQELFMQPTELAPDRPGVFHLAGTTFPFSDWTTRL
jgi:hypothetical protein